MAQSDVNRRVAEILREHDTLHGQHAGVAQQVVDQGARLDDHEGRIAGVRTDVDDVRNVVEEALGDGGRLDRQRDATVLVANRLRAEEDRGQARDQRLDAIERVINRLTRGPNWAFIGGAALVALIISRLFWHWVYFTKNWTFWLDGDYPSRLGFERHDPGQLMGNVWVLSIFTAAVVAGIAAGIMLQHEREDVGLPDDADQPVEEAQGGTMPPPPEPPPGVDRTDRVAAQR